MDIVNIKNLSFSYFEKKILFDISLNVKENEKLLLIGANGAGKSTLLRIICGLHSARFFNEFSVLNSISPCDQFNGLAYLGNRWVRNVAFMGQSPYSADIGVYEMMKRNQEENSKRRDELVELLEIDINWRMHQVSDGQRKRVQIMLALLKPFKLLLIDEFANDLDVVVRDNFFKYLDKECKERNGAVIYATHIFDNIEKWATHVSYISSGNCYSKETIENFNTSNNLYLSVKNKILNDKDRFMRNNSVIDKNLYGQQGGYGNGRAINL